MDHAKHGTLQLDSSLRLSIALAGAARQSVQLDRRGARHLASALLEFSADGHRAASSNRAARSPKGSR
jgi:hypothetical protein